MIKRNLLLLIAAFATLMASAEKVKIDGIYYNITSEEAKQAEVTFKGDLYYSYDDEYSGSITIPATVTHNGVEYSVTSIGEYAFFECPSLTSITIPESVTSIGNRAFSDCSSLASIILPEGVTSIGKSAFWNCSSLTAITIPEGVTSIDDYAFSGCSSLTSINIPEGVTSIGWWAFSDCSSLTTITLPEGVTSIGEYAFYECSKLTSITIPENVTSIGDGFFSGCSSLTAITIPEGVTSIGSYAFSGCSSLTSINIPEGVTSIGEWAFSGCSSLTAINIPEGVTSIGERAFSGCTSLTSINIPEGVTSIGSYAFSGCSSLTSINIPEGVTSIGDNAFKGCRNLTAITIPEGVTSIGESAFDGCTSLTSINIPEGVTSIGQEAFSGCRNLTAITIPEGVTSIGNYAFDDCSALKEVIIEDGSNTLSLGYNYYSSGTGGKGLFYDCPLESVYLGRNLSYNSDYSYGYSPFYCKTKLTSLTIGENVTSIDDFAFNGCNRLTAITISEGVTSIGVWAFKGCRNLTSITIPEGVTSIGEMAFYGCESLTSITIPESVTSIGEMAFDGCSLYKVINYSNLSLSAYHAKQEIEGSKLTTIGDFQFLTSNGVYYLVNYIGKDSGITLPNDYNGSNYDIGACAFLNCSSLTSINIPEGVTSIGDYAFAGCPELSDVYCYAETVPSTIADAFNGSHPGYATLHVPASAMNDYKKTAPWSNFGTIKTIENVTPEKCATPVISYVDGKVVFACDTDGAIVKSNFKDNNASDYSDSEVLFIPTYTITAYATKAQHEDSDVATLTLCWVPSNKGHEDNGILTIPAKPVLISAQGGTITVSGLADGTEVTVYNTAGTQLDTATATDDTVTLTTDLTAGNIAIVKMGDYSVKVAIK